MADRRTWRSLLHWRAELERVALTRLLRQEGGNLSAVARRLGTGRPNLRRLVKRLRVPVGVIRGEEITRRARRRAK